MARESLMHQAYIANRLAHAGMMVEGMGILSTCKKVQAGKAGMLILH